MINNWKLGKLSWPGDHIHVWSTNTSSQYFEVWWWWIPAMIRALLGFQESFVPHLKKPRVLRTDPYIKCLRCKHAEAHVQRWWVERVGTIRRITWVKGILGEVWLVSTGQFLTSAHSISSSWPYSPIESMLIVSGLWLQRRCLMRCGTQTLQVASNTPELLIAIGFQNLVGCAASAFYTQDRSVNKIGSGHHPN